MAVAIWKRYSLVGHAFTERVSVVSGFPDGEAALQHHVLVEAWRRFVCAFGSTFCVSC